jgi:transcription antitermination factor NusG
MGKIDLEALRKRARAAGIDAGSIARAARAQRASFGIGSRQTGINEPPAPVFVAPRALPMDDVRRWVVAVCKPSMARGVADDLNDLGFVAYCPLSRCVHLRARARVGRRKIIRQYPVFGVYIFVGEVDGPLQASIHSGISYLVGDSQGALSVPASFVLAINQDELDGKWDETRGRPSWAKTFKRGDQVRVKEGPFGGFSGLVDAVSKAGVDVDISMFGRMTTTTFKSSALELA